MSKSSFSRLWGFSEGGEAGGRCLVEPRKLSRTYVFWLRILFFFASIVFNG